MPQPSFGAAGAYVFTVTITDPGGQTATSSVNVTVNQTLTNVAVAPSSPVRLNAAATDQFTAQALDQFGNAMTSQPTFTWTTTVAGGTINSSSGLFTAPNTTASGTVKATSGSLNASSTVNVTNHAPTVATPASATPSPVTGTTTALAVLGADKDTGQSSLTYTWAATTVPNGASAPTFSVSGGSNGTNAAKNATATFSALGTYVFTVTITDPGGLTATSTVSVTVNQTLTTIVLSPLVGNADRGANAAVHGRGQRSVRQRDASRH